MEETITKEIDINECVFNFVYGEAMKDAVMQGAYKGGKKILFNLSEFGDLRVDVKSFIDNVLGGKFAEQKTYDDAFLDTARKVCDKINGRVGNEKGPGNSWFSFGNAQKLLNIMLKYYYITCNGNEGREKFRYCHCPMDRIMLKKVWEEYNCGLRTIQRMRDYEKKRTVFTESSWGTEDFEEDEKSERVYPKRYLAFQDAVRELAKNKGISPIEYDYSEWGNQ